jgi:hypothetical protein
MTRFLALLLIALALVPSPAAAEEPENDERSLVALRGSGSYQRGLKTVREKIEFADGPVEACHEVSQPEPKALGSPYKKGKGEIVTMSLEFLYPDLVREVLFVIYDYGYVQGMKHGSRQHNDDLEWAQTYYKSCVARANDAEHEPVYAETSKAWSEAILNGLRKEIDAHGLPAGKKPK